MASSSFFSSSSSSSSAAALEKWKYDVFLSFRGEDTRKNFVDHLYTALKQKGIDVFRDDEALERGKQISPELLKSIEESRFSIIVFSKNYAFSRWCLDELVKIMDCTKVTGGGHIALPIFYNVDPSDVRNQTGSFDEAFAKHEKDNSEDNKEKMQKWRIALSQAANLSGWDSRDKHESGFIQTIVEDMLLNLKPALLNVDNNFVGINFHLKELNIRLSIGPDDVKYLGIYGLGGIGKTTIAKAIYDNHSSHFEGCSFLANVREKSEKDDGLVSLQRQLLRNILKGRDIWRIHNSDEGSSMIKNRLRHIKVLVIVDDVDHSNQLKKLVGAQDWFGPGSRIILTTRDEHLLDVHDVIERYNVRELKPDESLELFSLKAFKQKQPKEGFLELSKDVVNYAKGLPLALNVLGSFLCGRNKIEYWNSTLDKLKEVPNKEITDVLKISYDGLDEKEKDIFLDIACFFKGKEKGYVTNILDSCGFYATSGIPVLIEKSLLTVTRSWNDNVLWMHDLVQDMGRYIGKHSRLWRYEDIRRVLNKNNDETEAIEAIMLEDWPVSEEDLLESDDYLPDLSEDWPEVVDFKKMSKLRLLMINGAHFPQGISNLPEELRILHWERCTLKYLSLPRGVVDLNLKGSTIVKLGDGRKALPHLKYIDLSDCYYLTSIPDLTRAPSVERLILFKCKKIFETQFLGNMKQLSELNLGECPITELPSTIENCARLKLLTLSECCNLVSLPSSICKLKYLEELHLNSCYKLEKLPENLGNLESLVKLRLFGCRKLEKLPENLGNLESLVKLDASRTSIKEAPPSIVRLKNLQSLSFGWVQNLKLHCFSGLCSLTELDLNYCYLSDGAIPSDFGSILSSLEELNLSGNEFVSLPSSISQLSRLTTLSLEFCNRIRALPELPSSIENLNGWNCASLERFSNTSTVFKPKNVRFDFYDCGKLDLTDALLQFQHQVRFGTSEKFSNCLPGNGTIPEWFSHQSTLGMQMPSNWSNTTKLRGLAFCIVSGDSENSFGFNKLATYDVKRNHRNLPKNHVMLGYISRACLRENENQLMKAAFYDDLFDENQLKCGIRLVEYDDDNEKENDQFKIRKLGGEPETALTLGIVGAGPSRPSIPDLNFPPSYLD